MKPGSAVDYAQLMPDVLSALLRVYPALHEHGLKSSITHLVQLRASQINQCAYCVKMHIEEARQEGETNGRLDRLAVWRHCDDYTPAERAALAWAEALTALDPRVDYAPLRAELREHFSESQIGALTVTVAMINRNRIRVSMD